MGWDHTAFMRAALEEAATARRQGNAGVGAVVVRDGDIVARGRNEVRSTFDVTAHAEVVALRTLSRRERRAAPDVPTSDGPLSDCVLYTTVEPCPMCCWAIVVAGIPAVVMGARLAQLGLTYGAYTVETLLGLTGRSVTVIPGILSDECAAVRRTEPAAPRGVEHDTP